MKPSREGHKAKDETMKLDTFEDQLRNQIRKYIRTVKADGTVSMSVDCLKQCVKTPPSSAPGAPNGTNAQYYYAQMFREICRTSPDIAAFTSM